MAHQSFYGPQGWFVRASLGSGGTVRFSKLGRWCHKQGCNYLMLRSLVLPLAYPPWMRKVQSSYLTQSLPVWIEISMQRSSGFFFLEHGKVVLVLGQRKALSDRHVFYSVLCYYDLTLQFKRKTGLHSSTCH